MSWTVRITTTVGGAVSTNREPVHPGGQTLVVGAEIRDATRVDASLISAPTVRTNFASAPVPLSLDAMRRPPAARPGPVSGPRPGA